MTEYPFESLAEAPLERDSVYLSGNRGTSADDPISKIVKCGNMGGFRKVRMKGTDDFAYIVIYSSGSEPEWSDEFYAEDDTFKYYGDNRTPGNPILNTHNKGNAILKGCFDALHGGDYSHIPPFLIFKKVEGQNSRSVRFLGVAVPGVRGMPQDEDLKVITHDAGKGSFDNYEAHFTVLPERVIDKRWLFSRTEGINREDLAPESWKEYMRRGVGDAPVAEHAEVIVEKDVQDPVHESTIFEHLHDEGLFYDTRIVEDFLLSLKAKQFLILSGGSGTGKTRLAQEYCRFRADSRYCLVSVGANWTDNRNMIGYMNALSGKYVGTPALDLMIRAEGSDDPHLLILDEMNLSHVERYFSDFLSAMESHEPVSTGSGDPQVPDRVSLKDNLFVIGTVNMDETTYAFSPKVLDRANVIEFEPASVTEFLEASEKDYDPHGDVSFLQDCMAGTEVRSMKAPDIISEMVASGLNSDVVHGMISLLDSAQVCMRSMKLPFGYRAVDELMRFMYVAWVYEGRGGFSAWHRYMDSQVMQKILPKIHGNASIRDGLVSLSTLCATSGLSRSQAKLDRMIEVLDNQRYVSFNC